MKVKLEQPPLPLTTPPPLTTTPHPVLSGGLCPPACRTCGCQPVYRPLGLSWFRPPQKKEALCPKKKKRPKKRRGGEDGRTQAHLQYIAPLSLWCFRMLIVIFVFQHRLLVQFRFEHDCSCARLRFCTAFGHERLFALWTTGCFKCSALWKDRFHVKVRVKSCMNMEKHLRGVPALRAACTA